MWSITNEQKQILQTPIPEQFIEYRDGQAFVNHNIVTSILNKAFGLAWSFNIVDQGIEETMSYNKKTEGQPKSYYCWVKAKISFPVQNERGEIMFVEREHFGGKAIVGNSQVQANAFKSAASDALKKAGSTMGIAQNVYMKPKIYEALLEEEAASVDSWTEENKAKFAKETEIVRSFYAGMGEEDFSTIVAQFCDEIGDYTFYGTVTPSNIRNFITWIEDKGYLAATKEEEKPKAITHNRRMLK